MVAFYRETTHLPALLASPRRGRQALARVTLRIAPGDLLGAGALRHPKALQAIIS